MHGISAFLIFIGFLLVAAALAYTIWSLWKNRRTEQISFSKLVFVTLFVGLWFSAISLTYVRKVNSLSKLRNLSPSATYSVQIGRHEFKDAQSIEAILQALERTQWFEVNHGGWGDSVRLTIKRRDGNDLVLEVAQYFRERGAIVRITNPRGQGLGTGELFSPELPDVLERLGVRLPQCDTPRGKPCTTDQLNP
jgi:hypothetical protein